MAARGEKRVVERLYVRRRCGRCAGRLCGGVSGKRAHCRVALVVLQQPRCAAASWLANTATACLRLLTQRTGHALQHRYVSHACVAALRASSALHPIERTRKRSKSTALKYRRVTTKYALKWKLRKR